MSPMVIMKVWQFRSLTVLKKRTTEFVRGIQATIDNDPIKSIRFIDREMGVSAFLARQEVLEDIEYFL